MNNEEFLAEIIKFSDEKVAYVNSDKPDNTKAIESYKKILDEVYSRNNIRKPDEK